MKSKNPLNIGVLTDSTDYFYSNDIIKGIQEEIREENARLFTFVLTYNLESNRWLNNIVSLINPDIIDALIISGTFSNNNPLSSIEKMIGQLKSLPIISLGVPIPGTYNILTDNKSGMVQLMIHLLDDHKYKKIAFIGGPKGHLEAEIRKNIFLQEMKKRGLDLPEQWIVHGNFHPYSGKAAIEELLSLGKPEFQGIVAANDNMAIVAIEHLQSKGYKIPEDFFVTGFDDFVSHTLTTIKQSVFDQGKKATQIIRCLKQNKEVEKSTILPSRLVIRSSCGCTLLDSCKYKTETMLEQDGYEKWYGILNDSFYASATQKEDQSFLTLLEEILRNNSDIDVELFWYRLLLLLRNKAIPRCKKEKREKEANTLLDKGCLLVMKKPKAPQLQNLQFSESPMTRVKAFSAALSKCITQDQCFNVAENVLPILGIKECYISFFNNITGNIDSSTLLFAYSKTGRIPIPPEGIEFKTKNLCPKEFLPEIESNKHLVIELLHTHQKPLGIILFSVNHLGCIYSNFICQNISSTLENILAREEQEIVKKKMIQSEKMAALGFLVAGVAHKINTPVGVGITAVSDIHTRLKKLIELYQSKKLTNEDFTTNVKVLKEESALVLSNLKEAADLVNNFKNMAANQSNELSTKFFLGEYLKSISRELQSILKEKNHSIKIQCPNGIELFGPKETIEQIFSQLIKNSVIHGFDNVENGEILINCEIIGSKIHIEYIDNGNGIEQEQLNRIFDPFFSTKLGKGSSGLGLHIVYNLITNTWKGTINCKSKVNEGIVFAIEIPISLTV